MKYLSLHAKSTISEKIQRMEKLALSNSIRPSLNNLILAELYVKAKKFAKAKTECKIFLLKNPATQKLAEILSILDKKNAKKSDTPIDLSDYPKDFKWVCANCGTVHDDWKAICDNCAEVGRVYWHLYIDNNLETEEY